MLALSCWPRAGRAHSSSPDHIPAISTAAGEPRSARRSAWLGRSGARPHVSLIVDVHRSRRFGAMLPPSHRAFTLAIAAILVVLGLAGLWQIPP